MGVEAYFADSVGMRCIHYLLERPRTPTHLKKLFTAIHGESIDSNPHICLDDSNDLQEACHSNDPILPPSDRIRIEEWLRTAKAELSESQISSPVEQCNKLEEEIEAAEVMLAKSGYGSRARNFGNETERARKSIGNAVARCIKLIGCHAPSLARHLKRSIRTGYEPVYEPEDAVQWTL